MDSHFLLPHRLSFSLLDRYFSERLFWTFSVFFLLLKLQILRHLIKHICYFATSSTAYASPLSFSVPFSPSSLSLSLSLSTYFCLHLSFTHSFTASLSLSLSLYLFLSASVFHTLFHCLSLSLSLHIQNTAIPAFGFEGHISAAVSRGPAPGRSRGWRGPAFDRSYCACPELTMTFFLLSSIQRSDEDWRLLAFFSSSITSTDKKCSQTKKKKAMQALFRPQWRAPRI